MTHYLAYWKAENAKYSDESYGGKLLHAASAYYSKVHKHDTVWIVTSKQGVFYLLGPIVMDVKVNTQEAERRLGMSGLHNAEYHILAKEEKAAEMKWIDVTNKLPKLRFSGTDKDRLPLGWGAGNLQSVRTLTEDSGKMLRQIYDEAGAPQESLLRFLPKFLRDAL
jgi:hypothetical protein